MKKIITVIVAVSLLLCTLCACSGSSPKTTIDKFERSVNSYDFEGIISCYEPSVQTVYSSVLKLLGSTIGVSDLETLVNGMGGLANIINTSVPGVMPSISITTESIEYVEPEKVLATLNVKYNYPDELKDQLPDNAVTEQTIQAYLVKIDGEWYFSSEIPGLSDFTQSFLDSGSSESKGIFD